MDLSAGVVFPEKKTVEQGTARGAASFISGGVIEGQSNNGNNKCQLPPLCFLASANNGKSDSLVSIVKRFNHWSVKDMHSDFSAANKHSANDGNAQISGIFPVEQGAGYDNNGLLLTTMALPGLLLTRMTAFPMDLKTSTN